MLLWLVGCASNPGAVSGVRLHDDVQRSNPRIVLFLCDGLRPDLLQRGCDEGWCPNIRERFIENGTRVENAVTAVPSITYAVLSTYATGAAPATHGVIANKWFDREQRLFRNYGTVRHYRSVNDDIAVPTIYELAAEKTTVSIQNAVHRGVSKNVANWAMSGVRWFFKDYTSVDKLTATTLGYVARWANRNGRWPHLLVCYFPGVDSIGHDFGPDSEAYRASVEHFDHQVGRVCDWLEREGMLEHTTLVLISDHGHVQIDKGIVDLLAYLRDTLGRNVTNRTLQDGPAALRRLHYDQFDTVLVASAVRFATIYLSGEDGWDNRPSPEAVRELLESPPIGERLWDNPGVDLVAYRIADNEVELRSPVGVARIAERIGQNGPEYRYVPVPDDVFGYMDDSELAAFVAAGFHTSREWLRATKAQQHPDIIPHLIPLLRSDHIGEAVLFAAHGYSFNHEKGGHGGIHRDEMRIPMMFAGPDIPPAGVLDTARAVDLAPTLLDILEVSVPEDDFDGVSLLPHLRNADEVRSDVVTPTIDFIRE